VHVDPQCIANAWPGRRCGLRRFLERMGIGRPSAHPAGPSALAPPGRGLARLLPPLSDRLRRSSPRFVSSGLRPESPNRRPPVCLVPNNTRRDLRRAALAAASRSTRAEDVKCVVAFSAAPARGALTPREARRHGARPRRGQRAQGNNGGCATCNKPVESNPAGKTK
jgi:hypothetical protein